MTLIWCCYDHSMGENSVFIHPPIHPPSTQQSVDLPTGVISNTVSGPIRLCISIKRYVFTVVHIPNINRKSYPKSLCLPLDEQMQRLTAVHDHVDAFLLLPRLGCRDFGCFHSLFLDRRKRTTHVIKPDASPCSEQKECIQHNPFPPLAQTSLEAKTHILGRSYQIIREENIKNRKLPTFPWFCKQ